MEGKLNQIAYATKTVEARNTIKRLLGLEGADWVKDTVEGTVMIPGLRPALSTALLEFNYDLGIEVEILTYLKGPNWHALRRDWADLPPTFLSHQGIHVEEFPRRFDGPPLVQEMVTTQHTNPYLIEKKRTFHYKIYDTRPTLGIYTKFIKRIEPK